MNAVKCIYLKSE